MLTKERLYYHIANWHGIDKCLDVKLRDVVQLNMLYIFYIKLRCVWIYLEVVTQALACIHVYVLMSQTII